MALSFWPTTGQAAAPGRQPDPNARLGQNFMGCPSQTHSKSAVPKASSLPAYPICLTSAPVSPSTPRGLVTPSREPPRPPEHPKVLLQRLSLLAGINYHWVSPQEPEREAQGAQVDPQNRQPGQYIQSILILSLQCT